MGARLGGRGLHGLLPPVQPRSPKAPLPSVRDVHVRFLLPHGCERQGAFTGGESPSFSLFLLHTAYDCTLWSRFAMSVCEAVLTPGQSCPIAPHACGRQSPTKFRPRTRLPRDRADCCCCWCPMTALLLAHESRTCSRSGRNDMVLLATVMHTVHVHGGRVYCVVCWHGRGSSLRTIGVGTPLGLSLTAACRLVSSLCRTQVLSVNQTTGAVIRLSSGEPVRCCTPCTRVLDQQLAHALQVRGCRVVVVVWCVLLIFHAVVVRPLTSQSTNRGQSTPGFHRTQAETLCTTTVRCSSS